MIENLEYPSSTVHDGKGKKDRTLPLPDKLIPELEKHLKRVANLHWMDLQANYDGVFTPGALDWKWENASKDWIFEKRGKGTRQSHGMGRRLRGFSLASNRFFAGFSRGGLLAPKGFGCGGFAETANIGVEQMGQGGAADEIGWHAAAGGAQPSAGVCTDGIGAGGGQGVGGAVRPGRDGDRGAFHLARLPGSSSRGRHGTLPAFGSGLQTIPAQDPTGPAFGAVLTVRTRSSPEGWKPALFACVAIFVVNQIHGCWLPEPGGRGRPPSIAIL